MKKRKRKKIWMTVLLLTAIGVLLWLPGAGGMCRKGEAQKQENRSGAQGRIEKAEIEILSPGQSGNAAFQEIIREKRESGTADGASGSRTVKTGDLTPIVGMLCLSLSSMLLAVGEILRRIKY